MPNPVAILGRSLGLTFGIRDATLSFNRVPSTEKELDQGGYICSVSSVFVDGQTWTRASSGPVVSGPEQPNSVQLRKYGLHELEATPRPARYEG